MDKKQFEELIKNKTSEDLHRLLSRYANGLTNLTSAQVNKCINLKKKLEKKGE